jgi:hypothetical protein
MQTINAVLTLLGAIVAQGAVLTVGLLTAVGTALQSVLS